MRVARFALSAVIVALAALAPAFPPLPLDLRDVDSYEILAGSDPAALDDRDHRERARAARAALLREGPAAYRAWREDLEDSELPPIVREAVLYEVATEVARSGQPHWLPVMAELATESPGALYRDATQRAEILRPWFDYPAAARRAGRILTAREAELRTRAQIAAGEAVQLEPGSDPAALAGVLEAVVSSEPAGRRGSALETLIGDTPSDQAVLSAADHVVLAEAIRRYELYAYFDDASRFFARHTDAEGLLALLRVWNDLRNGDSAEWQRLWVAAEDNTMARRVLVTQLEPTDGNDAILSLLTALLDDEELGSDAGLALARIAPDRLVEKLSEVLGDEHATETAVRRALLRLMRDGSPEARVAIEQFARTGTESHRNLSEEARRWLDR